VVHALREVDWRLRLLRTYYVRHDSSLDFADLIRELTRADGLAFQYVIIGPDGLMVMSSAATPGAVVNLQDRISASIATRARTAFSSASQFLARSRENGRSS
jgi:hypothetical protein